MSYFSESFIQHLANELNRDADDIINAINTFCRPDDIICSGNARRLCTDTDCHKCLKKSFATHPRAVYWSKQNTKTPRDFFKSARAECLFDCDVCFHTFTLKLNSVTSIEEQWCPFCAHQRLCSKEDCDFCFNNSFASHPKAKYWSKDNIKNPRDLFRTSKFDAIFDCDICDHPFNSNLTDVGSENAWCGYCAHRILCKGNCDFCFNNSFASHPKAKYWSKENKETPREVFRTSAVKYLFDCDVCGHLIKTALDGVACGSWCSYCSHQKLCKNDDCDFCFNNSFASHPKAKYWSKENKETPREVFKSSNFKRKFNCNLCDKLYTACLDSIVRGTWCYCMKNKTETKLFEHLLTLNLGSDVERQKKFSWCKNKTYLPFDFCLGKYKLLIELDGPQHFRQVSNWAPPEITQAVDAYKTECANKNGYSVIRMLQTDVWDDKNDWKNVLDKLINDNKNKY